MRTHVLGFSLCVLSLIYLGNTAPWPGVQPRSQLDVGVKTEGTMAAGAGLQDRKASAHGTGVRVRDERLEMHKTNSWNESSDARVVLLGSYSVVQARGWIAHLHLLMRAVDQHA